MGAPPPALRASTLVGTSLRAALSGDVSSLGLALWMHARGGRVAELREAIALAKRIHPRLFPHGGGPGMSRHGTGMSNASRSGASAGGAGGGIGASVNGPEGHPLMDFHARGRVCDTARHGGADSRCTPLCAAVRGGHLACARELLAAGASVDGVCVSVAPHHGSQGSHRSRGSPAARRSALSSNSGGGSSSSTILRRHCRPPHHLPCLSLLLTAGTAPDACDLFGSSCLHAACEYGDHLLAEALLAHGADAGARDAAGKTPLMCASTGEVAAAVLGACGYCVQHLFLLKLSCGHTQ